MGELAQGGYSKQWRQQVLEDALTGYKRFWAMEHEGTGHVNRPEGATANKRRAERLVGKSTWFMKPPNKNNKVKVSCNSTFKVKTKCRSKVPNKTETVLFIPFTPNSELKRKLQEAESFINGRNKTCHVRMIERPGQTMASLLFNKHPWSQESCGRETCLPCQTKAGSCRKSNVTYRVKCQECLKSGKPPRTLGSHTGHFLIEVKSTRQH